MLFEGILHLVTFSLNIYSNAKKNVKFDIICNLFTPHTIDQCYDCSNDSIATAGIKNNDGTWNISGSKDRIVEVSEKELKVFAKLFDGTDKWKTARLPIIHTKEMLYVLSCFAAQAKNIASLASDVFTTEMWHETNAQKEGVLSRAVSFPTSLHDMVYSGPHIGVANPLYKTPRSVCMLHSDYDTVLLNEIGENYLPRTNYVPVAVNYRELTPNTPWGEKYLNCFRLVSRRMLSQTGERTLMATIIPPDTSHINTVFGIAFKENIVAFMAGCFAAIPFDYFIKATGKSDGRYDTLSKLPLLSKYYREITIRSLKLNCLTKSYSSLWEKTFDRSFLTDSWSKQDHRLTSSAFSELTEEWHIAYACRSDFERHQALVEMDVLVAISLGMSLSQLKTIYLSQFPVLYQNEVDTWYDQKGQIVFTNNRGLVGVGFDRPSFEKPNAVTPIRRGEAPWNGVMKDAPAGYVFARTITDDTQPGGPVQRTIEYVAPFDKCDREQDYETAWEYFSKQN